MNKSYYILLLLVVTLYSCISCNNEAPVENEIRKWYGHKINIPVLQSLNDTPLRTGDDLTILVHIDSEGCTSCKIRLNEWQSIFNEIDTISSKNIPTIFIIDTITPQLSKDIEQYKELKKQIYVDTNGAFRKQNTCSNDIRFQSFLLNKNNEIIIVGNPAYNAKVRKLYIDYIKKQ